MSTLIGSTEAAGTLGVTKPTLYAYVSRGVITRQLAVDGRTSLYDKDELERLVRRSRRRTPTERPSIDVQIATGITQLNDDSPTYRGRRVTELATGHRFEDVVELLLTGEVAHDTRLVVERAALDRAKRMIAAAVPVDPITALSITALSIGDRFDEHRAADAARCLLALAPSVLGGPQRGDVASRLARAWVRRPTPELVRAISVALVLLADHELATSTLAVRVAASVRSGPAPSIVTGLCTVAGPLHGGASQAAAALFDDASMRGALRTVRERVGDGRRLPGFGHTVYRSGDPRFAPLLDAVRRIPAPPDRVTTVDDVIREAGRAIGQLPNVDLALGALYFVAGLPRDAPIFAIARIAGWAAHYAEEIGERPVRFRGLAKQR